MRQSMPMSRTRKEHTICRNDPDPCQQIYWNKWSCNNSKAAVVFAWIDWDSNKMKKHELTCLPRLDMNPVADNSFILASMRGYLESNDKMEKQYSFNNRKYDLFFFHTWSCQRWYYKHNLVFSNIPCTAISPRIKQSLVLTPSTLNISWPACEQKLIVHD
jgi:hypothetical protein